MVSCAMQINTPSFSVVVFYFLTEYCTQVNGLVLTTGSLHYAQGGMAVPGTHLLRTSSSLPAGGLVQATNQ